MERVENGDLAGRVEVGAQDDVGRMGNALNAAIASLRRTVEALSRSAVSVSSSSSQLAGLSRALCVSAEQGHRCQARGVLSADQLGRHADPGYRRAGPPAELVDQFTLV